MYKCIWNSPEHGQIPCNVQREVGDQLVIRVPDPFDKGEVEISVPAEEVALVEATQPVEPPRTNYPHAESNIIIKVGGRTLAGNRPCLRQ